MALSALSGMTLGTEGSPAQPGDSKTSTFLPSCLLDYALATYSNIPNGANGQTAMNAIGDLLAFARSC